MATLSPEQRKEQIWSVIRVSSGNFLEMYDFFVFGYYATAIGRAFFPTGSDFAQLMLAFMTFGDGFFDAPARWHFPRHLHRPLRTPRRTYAHAGAYGRRNDNHRLGSRLYDTRRLGPRHCGDWVADPRLFRRRRARRRLRLPGGNRNAGTQRLLRQLAVRQPSGRGHLRRAPRRAAEPDHSSRIDAGVGLAHSVSDRVSDHSAPVHPAALARGNRGVLATAPCEHPSQAAGNPAATRTELANRHHRHAAG